MCATILLTGIGVSAVTANEKNSGDENTQSKITFCLVNTSKKLGKALYSYGGFFIESNGNVRNFCFEDIEDEWTLIFGDVGDDYADTNGTTLLMRFARL